MSNLEAFARETDQAEHDYRRLIRDRLPDLPADQVDSTVKQWEAAFRLRLEEICSKYRPTL